MAGTKTLNKFPISHHIKFLGTLFESTENFIDAIKTVQVPDDYKLVSFGVKSLFTSIPLQLALDCTETAINNSTIELPLPTDDLMDLLNPCLTSTYFQYNGTHYKQLHGTAMGSPVSVVVAEIVMQNIEERALATYKRTLPLWLRYVDDTFTAVHKDEIDDFHPRQKRTTDDNLQKTDTYRQTTRPIILQPNFSQSYDYTDPDKTRTTSL